MSETLHIVERLKLWMKYQWQTALIKTSWSKTTGSIIRSRLKISISWVSNVSKTFYHLSSTTWRWLRKIFTCRLTFWALAHLRFIQAAVNWCNNHISLELNNWFVYFLLFVRLGRSCFQIFPKICFSVPVAIIFFVHLPDVNKICNARIQNWIIPQKSESSH